jgi:O-antigen ligase
MIIVFLLTLPLSESLKQISSWSIFLIFIYFVFHKDIKLKLDIMDYSLIAHLFVIIIGIFVGINHIESIKQSKDFFIIMLTFFVFRNIDLSILNIKFMINLILISFIVTVLWGLYNFLQGDIFIELKSVGSPNRSAVYISLVFVLSFTLIFYEKKSFLLYTSLILSLVAIIFGGSRMAIYSLPILILITLYLNNKFTLKNIIFVSLGLIIIACFVLLFFNHSYFREKILKGFSDTPRIQLWISSIHIWLNHNLFFGIGVGNSIYFDPRTYFPSSSMTYIDNAHNTFLDMLLERGLFGLITYLSFIFLALNKFLKMKKTYIFLSQYYNIGILFFAVIFIMSFANITFRYEFALLVVTIWGSLLNKKLIENEKNLLHTSK